MTNASDHIEDMIASVLAGEASAEQAEAVERWRQASPMNGRHFEQIRLIYEQSAGLRETISFDTDKAWERVRRDIELHKNKSTSSGKVINLWPLVRIAAGFILLIAVGLFGYRYIRGGAERHVGLYAENETLADTLPDGSRVFLNRQARIDYSFDTKTRTHTARLKGEAYFDVQHTDETTFIVEIGETFIRDIGTAFNVQAYPESNTIEVVVDEGEVLFYTKNNEGVHVKASSKGIYDRSTGRFTLDQPEPNVTAYKTKSFIFSNTPLESVVSTINSVYDTTLRIDDKLKTCRITVSFKEESIDEIAQVISETLGLSVTMEGRQITLHGEGCGEEPSE